MFPISQWLWLQTGLFLVTSWGPERVLPQVLPPSQLPCVLVTEGPRGMSEPGSSSWWSAGLRQAGSLRQTLTSNGDCCHRFRSIPGPHRQRVFTSMLFSLLGTPLPPTPHAAEPTPHFTFVHPHSCTKLISDEPGVTWHFSSRYGTFQRFCQVAKIRERILS